MNQEQINQTNNNLKQLLWQPLKEAAIKRNTPIIVKTKKLGKIPGKRRCIKCKNYFSKHEIKRRGRYVYCKECERTARVNPKCVDYLKP